MATVRERMLLALANRVSDLEAKLEATRVETKWALEQGNKVLDPDDLFWHQTYIDFLADVAKDTTRRLIAARRTLEKARDARVTGRLQ